MSVYTDQIKNARINGAGQNNGGVLGGIGYLTEKLALGTVSGLEGIVDYTVGGLAKLFGADEFAEDIFDDDWLDYGHADEWYDPSEGWKFAGDVAGGIGTSIPSIVGAVAGGALIAASGGTAAPAGIKLIGASLAPLAAGLSGAGNATKDAYRETGVLTGKEFGYGALTGATEAGLEALTGGIGTGTARIAKNIVKSMAKETGETITKLGAKSVFKTLAGDFASEAFEEGLAEFLSPQYQRMTYNPDAKNATAEEIRYAALVGGLSGLVMGGSAQVMSTGSNLISGNRAVENGNADSIMKTAQYFADFEAKGETGYESFKTIKEVSARLSESLLKTNGQVSTVSQKIMLGQLQRANVAATFMPFVERSASTVLADADGVVARFNELGMTDENGKRLSFTKEELLKGIRTDLLGKSSLTRSERIELNRSIRKSLESGGALSKLAVMDATGRITMSTKRLSESIMHGRKIKSADELNRFVETAKPEEINALSDFLGIEDWRRETIDSINRKIDAARADGRFEQLKNEFKAKKVTSSTGEGVGNGPSRTPVPTGDIGIVPNNAGIVPNNVGIVPNNVPNIVPQSTAPGGSFAALESDIVKTLANKNAVTRMNSENMQATGDNINVESDNKIVDSDNKIVDSDNEIVDSDNRSKIDLVKETMEIDAWAAEKVPEYMKLSEPNRRAVRATVRQARAAGISETSARTMARVAARSGLNVVFDFEGLRVDGDDGLYDGSNTIFLNPSADGQRLARSLLLHEAGHALISGNAGTKAGSKIVNRLISETKKKNDIRSESLRNKYRDSYKDKGFKQEQLDFVIEEEVLMHHLEDVLGSESAWEYILSEDASIGQRFLSFLRRSAQVYSDSDALSSEARRLLRDYKKLFESFAERNYQRNAVANEKSPAEGRGRSAIQEENNSTQKISSKMTDAERYEILKDRTISLGAKTNNERLAEVQKKLDITDENIEFSKYGDRVRLFKKMGDEFSLYHEYRNNDIKLDFMFSKEKMRESVSKQRRNYMRLAKMLTCIDSVIDNAIGIESHNRNLEGYKTDDSLKNVYVLASAFVDGENIIPVKLEVKEFLDKDNTLHLAIALESIKKDEIVKQEVANNGVARQYSPSSTISIAEMFKKINPSDESFLKYIPDGFLDEIQLEAKRKALEADAKKGKTVETNEDAEKLLKERRALPEEDMEAFFEEDERSEGTSSTAAAVPLPQGEGSGKGQSRTPVPTGDSEKGKAAKRVPSRGEVAKRNADMHSDRVYNRKEIFESLKRVLPGDITVSVTDELWEGLNSQRNAAGRRAYIESMIPRVNKMLIVESRRFENADPSEIKEAEGRVAEALAGLLSKGTESKRVRLDAAEKVKAAEKDAESKVNAARKNAAEKIAKERDKRSKREEHWKTTAKNLQSETYLRGLLSDKAYQMKDLKIGRFRNATEAQVEIFRGSIEKLSKIQFRGNLSPKMIRRTVRELREGWYTKDNPVLQYVDKNDPGLYNEGIAEMMDALATGDSVLSVSELKTLHDVMSYFVNFVQNFGKVYRRGKWIEAEPEAKRYIGGLQSNAQLNVGLFRRLAGSTYSELFSDPMVVARRFDFYESDGFYTEMMEDFRDAAVDAQVAEMEIREAYDAFMEKNKRYVEKANAEEVEYRGAKLSKMHFIGLYMTMKRHHAVAGLVLNGFAFDNVKGDRVRVPGLLPEAERVTEAELRSYADEQIALMADKLSEADKEYVSILEKVYNEDARALKVERDMQRMGFTNASDDYYYPIKRGNTATSLDSDFKAELDRVSSASFNKDTVKGAKQELFIESADKVFNRHLRAVCQYAYLSPAIDAYDRLFHLDISGNPNKPVNISTESVKVWKKGNDYFKKLIADIQGISPASKEGQELLGRIRGSYAKYQLGANPKVWLTQLSSLCASSSILDFDSIARGMGLSSEGLDKYCSLAKLRNNDNTAAMAQGVLDTRAKRAANGISRFGDLLMAPIGKMDRFVVGRLFGACQAQVEKDGGARIGTEENKIEAGKLLRRVLLETQQNSVATERSAAMRSGNELLKAITMFSADSMKVTGRVIDALGELSTLKARLKGETDAGKRAVLEKRIKAANRKVLKASGAMVTAAIFMASVAQLFRFIYDKEDKDDKGVIETMTADAVGNLFGGLPLFRDVYSIFTEGYEVNNYAYDMFNDLIDSCKGLIDETGKIMKGEGTPEGRNLAFRNLIYSVGQFTGLPVRNVYNVFYGLTKRFSPETAYKIDGAFYKKNYQNDLFKAIEAGDDKKVAFVMELLLGERINGDVDEVVYNELLTLAKAGQKVLPKTMPATVTVEGGEYALTADEREAMRSIYSGSEDSLKKLFSSASYKSLSDEDKAIAIDYVSDIYYDKALSGALSMESGKKAVIFADAVGIEKMALLYVKTKGIESDVDASGKTVSGSKKKKVLSIIKSMGGSVGEKLLMLYSRGYKVADGDFPGMKADFAKKLLISYIMKIPGKTSKEKAAIAEACGFTVVNGRIKMG